jgi:hypothetical protein
MGAKAQARTNMDPKGSSEAKPGVDPKTIGAPMAVTSAAKRTLPQAFVFDPAKSHSIVQVCFVIVVNDMVRTKTRHSRVCACAYMLVSGSAVLRFTMQIHVCCYESAQVVH